jgi:hypothetical protein
LRIEATARHDRDAALCRLYELRQTGEMLRGGQPRARGSFSFGVYAAFSCSTFSVLFGTFMRARQLEAESI